MWAVSSVFSYPSLQEGRKGGRREGVREGRRKGGREGGRREGGKEERKGGRREGGKGEGREELREGGGREGKERGWNGIILFQSAPGRSHVKFIPQNSMSCSESKFWPIRF